MLMNRITGTWSAVSFSNGPSSSCEASFDETSALARNTVVARNTSSPHSTSFSASRNFTGPMPGAVMASAPMTATSVSSSPWMDFVSQAISTATAIQSTGCRSTGMFAAPFSESAIG